jgi:hypothetical protein
VPHRRVIITTVLTTVIGSAIAITINLATDWKTNLWAWLGVVGLTALLAVVLLVAASPPSSGTRNPGRRRSQMLIALGAVALLAGIVIVYAVNRTDSEPTSIVARPTTLDTVQADYSVREGTIELDLTALPAVGTMDTTVRVGRGDVRVAVGPGADVEAFCAAGSVNCLGRTESEASVIDDGGDGPGGLKIHLNARSDEGTVEVLRIR